MSARPSSGRGSGGERRNRLGQRLVDRWRQEVRTVVGPASGVIVDVGGGGGAALAHLGVEAAPVVVVVADLDEARERRDRRGWLPVVADPAALPLASACADLVTCVAVLEGLASPRPVVRELARTTGGRCVVSVPWEPWHRLGDLSGGRHVRRLGRDPDHVQAFTPKRLVRVLRRGFRDVTLHPCLPWLIAESRGPRP